jgi:hypothetical protein
MGFFTERRPSYPVRVLITDSAAHDPGFSFAGLQAGETYEVNPHLAEYLIGTRQAIIDRRHSQRSGESKRDPFGPRV